MLRQLGKTPFVVSPIGFGAFKIGRNEGVKYPSGYDLPDERTAARLLNEVLDLGINLVDTAPAYGLSEERIGRAISHRRADFVLSTKVGETFENGVSRYEFSGDRARASVERSLRRLRTDVLDLLFIHSDGRDTEILRETDIVEALLAMREEGLVRAVGLSGKTNEGFEEALEWADVLMVEYNERVTGHAAILKAAAERGIGVLIKKGLASGTLDSEKAIRFALTPRAVASVVVGSLDAGHLRASLEVAEASLADG